MQSKKLMSPELKKTIIKFVPDYFSWDKKCQEQYRVDIPEEDSFKIRQFLLRELFDIKTDAKGLEPQLDELKHRFWKHISEVYERLMDEFDKKSNQSLF